MQVDLQVIFGDSWRKLRKVLTSDIQRAMDAYWNRARMEEGRGQLISPAAEVNAMLLISLTRIGQICSSAPATIFLKPTQACCS